MSTEVVVQSVDDYLACLAKVLASQAVVVVHVQAPPLDIHGMICTASPQLSQWLDTRPCSTDVP